MTSSLVYNFACWGKTSLEPDTRYVGPLKGENRLLNHLTFLTLLPTTREKYSREFSKDQTIRKIFKDYIRNISYFQSCSRRLIVIRSLSFETDFRSIPCVFRPPNFRLITRYPDPIWYSPSLMISNNYLSFQPYFSYTKEIALQLWNEASPPHQQTGNSIQNLWQVIKKDLILWCS